MRLISSRICDDLTSPKGAYERAYVLCREAVTLERAVSGAYVGEAIKSLTRKGDFGSWLKKLFHKENVTIHLHYYERLVRIVEEQAAANRRKIDHVEDMIKVAKGRRNASNTGSNESDHLRHQAPA